MTTLDNTLDNLLERAFDAEQSGNLILAAELRAQYRKTTVDNVHSDNDQAAPALPPVHIREDGDEGDVWSTFVAGSGLTSVEVSPNDDRPGVSLAIGGKGINTQLTQIITLADLRQLYNNLGAILSDPRLAGYTPPLPTVQVEHWQSENGTSFANFTAGDGLTRVLIGTNGDAKPGFELIIGGNDINTYIDEVITLRDVQVLRDNLTALLNDPHLGGGPVPPVSIERLYHEGDADGDLTEEPCGPLAYRDYCAGDGDTEVAISFDVTGTYAPDVDLASYPSIKLDQMLAMLPNLLTLLNDPRVQAERARYEAASAPLMKAA